LQLENAFWPISFTEPGIVIDSMFVSEKALSPISFTVLGIVIDLMFVS